MRNFCANKNVRKHLFNGLVTSTVLIIRYLIRSIFLVSDNNNLLLIRIVHELLYNGLYCWDQTNERLVTPPGVRHNGSQTGLLRILS